MTSNPAQPPIRCWFCDWRFNVAQIERDGILRSRRDHLGGPFRILLCPHCTRENLCERTLRGRWFSSPNLRVSFLEYFFSQILDTRPEDFLTAASWYKENEDRRRYFFERDGDSTLCLTDGSHRGGGLGFRHGHGSLSKITVSRVMSFAVRETAHGLPRQDQGA